MAGGEFQTGDMGNPPNRASVMCKMEKHCIGEVNEIFERYCFNKRDKLPTETVDNFVADLKTLAKTCNLCVCLRDSLIRDRILLGIKNKQAIFKTENGESENENGERGTGNGERGTGNL